MRAPQSQLLLIEALLDGELTGQDALTAMKLLNSSPEMRQLYDALKEQKEAIKHAFLEISSRH